MRCLHINIRKSSLIIIALLINNVQHSQMADNHMDLTTKPFKNSSIIFDSEPKRIESFDFTNKDHVWTACPADMECDKLSPSCLNCNMNYGCIYGKTYTTNCEVLPVLQCIGERSFKKEYICRYCYQTESWEHKCDLKANCNSIATSRSPYTTNCTVIDGVLCLGNRLFNKNVFCNWTRGYRWSTALALSVTLGGFGADRFYLGHWQEGIGKLFSFGGLGVWTLIDVILISLHYLGPADGSLYI